MATDSKISAAQVAAIEAAKPVAQFAVELAKADVAYEQVLPTIATNVARILGNEKEVTFEKWEAVQSAFIAAYVKQRNCVEETGRNRWVAVAGWLKNNMALEKPAKKTDAAGKKAKERAKAEKEIKQIKAQYVKPADAFAAAAELAKQGKVAEAKKVTAAAHALAKDVIDDSNKQASGQLKKVRDELRKEIGKCGDIPALRAALEWLQSGKELKTELKREAARKVSQASRVRSGKQETVKV